MDHLRSVYGPILELQGLEETFLERAMQEYDERNRAENLIENKTDPSTKWGRTTSGDAQAAKRVKIFTKYLATLSLQLKFLSRTYQVSFSSTGCPFFPDFSTIPLNLPPCLQDRVKKFLLMLASAEDVSLQLLSVRLDFNEYYKSKDSRLVAPLTYQHRRQSEQSFPICKWHCYGRSAGISSKLSVSTGDDITNKAITDRGIKYDFNPGNNESNLLLCNCDKIVRQSPVPEPELSTEHFKRENIRPNFAECLKLRQKIKRINLKNVDKSKSRFKEFLEREIIRHAEFELKKNLPEELETPISPIVPISYDFREMKDFSLYPPSSIAFMPFEHTSNKIPNTRTSESIEPSERHELSGLNLPDSSDDDKEEDEITHVNQKFSLNDFNNEDGLQVYDNHFAADNLSISFNEGFTKIQSHGQFIPSNESKNLSNDSESTESSSDRTELCSQISKDFESKSTRRRRNRGIIPCCLG